jgi:hypothetical protein
MSSGKLARWSTICGVSAIILYFLALIVLWKGGALITGMVDRKDLYFAGSGLLYIAIWLKVSAIYSRNNP